MATAPQILRQLRKLADPQKLAGMERYGITTEKRLGVAVPDMRQIAKGVKKDRKLALELWATGIAEAKIVASMVAVPEEMTSKDMDDWVSGFDSWDVCDQVCMNLFEKMSPVRKKIEQWSRREEPFVKRAAFACIACLAWHDKQASDQEFAELFPILLREAKDERNYVKKAVSWALRNIGKRNPVLCDEAIQLACQIGRLDSKAARWIAADVRRELESAAVKKRLAAKVAACSRRGTQEPRDARISSTVSDQSKAKGSPQRTRTSR